MASQTKVGEMIAKNNAKKGGLSDKIVPIILAIISAISILTTIAILFTLLTETITFSHECHYLNSFIWYLEPNWFITRIWNLGTHHRHIENYCYCYNRSSSDWFRAAIYLNEYASDRSRRIIKPILEILAGIPTIVFGFFALTFVTPILRNLILT